MLRDCAELKYPTFHSLKRCRQARGKAGANQVESLDRIGVQEALQRLRQLEQAETRRPSQKGKALAASA